MVDESWFCNLLGSGRVTSNPSLIRLWKAGRQSAQNPSTRRVARGWRPNRVPDYKQNPECLVVRRGFTKKPGPKTGKKAAKRAVLLGHSSPARVPSRRDLSVWPI